MFINIPGCVQILLSYPRVTSSVWLLTPSAAVGSVGLLNSVSSVPVTIFNGKFISRGISVLRGKGNIEGGKRQSL